MPQLLPFLISIERRNENGIDVEAFVNSASCAIADRAKYKLRVRHDVTVIVSNISKFNKLNIKMKI